jgi:RNA polymerase sigma factor (sigma-70 family)
MYNRQEWKSARDRHGARDRNLAQNKEEHREAIAEDLRPRLFNLFMYLTNSQDVAEDLTQETFVRFWESLSHFRGECSMLTWATRIAHNTLCDYQRRQSRERRVMSQPLEDWEEAASPEETLEQVTLRCAVAQALQQLPDVERRAVVLVKIEGLSYREASTILGEPEGTLRWRVMEGLSQLKELLKDPTDSREEGDGQDVHLYQT